MKSREGRRGLERSGLVQGMSGKRQEKCREATRGPEWCAEV